MNPPVIMYQLDLTGQSEENLVLAEPHDLVVPGNRAFVPNHGPFYTDGLVVRNRNTGVVLVPNTEYKAVQLMAHATLRTGLEVCSVIVIDEDVDGTEFEIDYQVPGGDYSSSVQSIVQLIETLEIDNRNVLWGAIIGRPEYFPPAPHLHDIGDVYGFEYIVAALEQIRQAILLGDAAAHNEIYLYIDYHDGLLDDRITELEESLAAHIADKDNPHDTTKAHVGLGLVQNYPIATPAQALAGTSNTTYLTPYLMRLALEAYSPTPVTPPLAISLSPPTLTQTRLSTVNPATVFSNYITPIFTGGGVGTPTVVWTIVDDDGRPADVSIQTSGNTARLRFVTNLVPNGGDTDTINAVMRCTATLGAETVSADVVIALTAERDAIAPPALSLGLSPSAGSNSFEVQGVTSATVQSVYWNPILSGGTGTYSVFWSFSNNGGRPSDVSIGQSGNSARLIFTTNNLPTVGSSDTVTVSLRCTVTSGTQTASVDVVITVDVTRIAEDVVLPPVTLDLAPSPLVESVVVPANSSPARSSFIVPTFAGGNGTYSVIWSIANSGGRPFEIGLEEVGTTARLRFSSDFVPNGGDTDSVTVILRCTVSSNGETVFEDVSVTLNVSRVADPPIVVSLAPSSNTKNFTIAGNGIAQYSDFIAPSLSGGDGSYDVVWSIVDDDGRPSTVAIGQSGNNARLIFTPDALTTGGSTDNMSAVLRCTVESGGNTQFADVAININTTRAFDAPTVSLAPSPSITLSTSTVNPATRNSLYIVPTLGAGNGVYSVVWSIFDNGGRGSDISIEQSGNNCRMSFTSNALSTIGSEDFVNAVLRCSVTSAGLTTHQNVSCSITIERISGGGGGPGGCVALSMFVDATRQAGELQIGDLIDGAVYDTENPYIELRTVRNNTVAPQPVLRMVTASGIELEASDSTPFTLQNGATKYMPDMLGEMVLVDDEGTIRWEEVVDLQALGVRDVVLINIDSSSFFAGTFGTRRIASHNLDKS